MCGVLFFFSEFLLFILYLLIFWSAYQLTLWSSWSTVISSRGGPLGPTGPWNTVTIRPNNSPGHQKQEKSNGTCVINTKNVASDTGLYFHVWTLEACLDISTSLSFRLNENDERHHTQRHSFFPPYFTDDDDDDDDDDDNDDDDDDDDDENDNDDCMNYLLNTSVSFGCLELLTTTESLSQSLGALTHCGSP